MKERHRAYYIKREKSGVITSYNAYESDKMLDILNYVKQHHTEGIYWIFKQLDNEPWEALSFIDCAHNRIYYHYSGEVENIEETIKLLSQ